MAIVSIKHHANDDINGTNKYNKGNRPDDLHDDKVDDNDDDSNAAINAEYSGGRRDVAMKCSIRPYSTFRHRAIGGCLKLSPRDTGKLANNGRGNEYKE